MKSRSQTAPGYPPRLAVAEKDAPWSKALQTYKPPEYTAPVVLENEGRWADPSDIHKIKRPFLTRSGRGEIAVQLDARGHPLNPIGRTGLQGRGLLGRWGRNLAGDPMVTRVNPDTRQLELLVIQRKDSGKVALPGGMVDEGEAIAATTARELLEETGAEIDFKNATILFAGVVDDPRNTDNSWMETTVLHKHLSADEQKGIILRAGDDAKSARWREIDLELLSSMYASHGDYVRLALPKLAKIPATREQVSELLK